MSAFTLPNGILHEGKLFNQVTLDEIRGKHQNILVNPSPKTPIDHLEPILSDLIIDITTIESESILSLVSKKETLLNKLSIQDIQFLMVKIREVSYDSTFLMELECNHCGGKNNAKLDLSSLEVFPREDKITEDKMILPKEGLKFSYKHLSLSNLKKGMFVEGTNNINDKIITETTSYLLASLGDKTSGITSKDLEELRGSDGDYIRDNAPKLAEIDLKVEHTCKYCGKDFEQELPVLAADFLLPTRI